MHYLQLEIIYQANYPDFVGSSDLSGEFHKL